MTMRRYEIINPSDACCIEAPSDLIAGLAIMLISEGRYGLRRDDDETTLPILAFGGDAPIVAWLKENGIEGLEAMGAFVSENTEAIARTLESIFYGSMSQAKALDDALAGLPDALERRAKFNDGKRSSMSDIGKACLSYAAALRRKHAKKERT